MKNNIKKVTLFCLLAISVDSFAASTIKFEEALKKGIITYKVNSRTEFDRTMHLNLVNNSNTPINVQLEAGRIFYSAQDIQPFVVTRPSIIALEPKSEDEVLVYARCGNSTARGPSSDTKFGVTKMGPERLVNALTELNNKQINNIYFSQQVVWHFTNDHSLNSIITHNDKEVEFLKWMCNEEKTEYPWYQKHYAQSASGDDMEFSNMPTLIQGEMNIVLSNQSNIKVKLCDNDGNTLKTLSAYMNQPAGQLSVPLNINLLDLERGEYKIIVENDSGAKIEERSITV